jgi:hypothetical protein
MKDKEQAPHATGVGASTAQDRGMAEVWQNGASTAQPKPPPMLACCYGPSGLFVMLHRPGMSSVDVEDAPAWWYVSAAQVVAVYKGSDGLTWVETHHGRMDTDASIQDVVWAVDYRLKEQRGRVYRVDPPGPR